MRASSEAKPRDLSPLLAPRSIAIVGASESSSYARRVLGHLREWSFAGRVHAVNPRTETVAGLRCTPSLKALPEPVDLAFIVVGRDSVLEVLHDCHETGVPAAIVVASGFAESADASGRRLNHELVTFAAETGLVVSGPNCLGLINFHDKVPAFAGPVDLRPTSGKLAVVSQSGGNLCAMLSSAFERHIGMSYAISSGNEAVVGFCDYVDFLVDDARTEVICAFLEAVPDADRFHRTALRAARARKPIVAIKVGRSRAGSDAVLAHTGALAGPDDLVQALFDEVAIIRAGSIDDALDKATLFATLPRSQWPRGRNVAFFSVGGGAVGIFADLADERRVKLPPLPDGVRERLLREYPETVMVKNPMDLPGWQRGQQPELMPLFLEECLEQATYDGAIVALSPYPHLLAGLEPARSSAARSAKPLIATLFASISLPPEAHRFTEQTGIPVIAGLDRCIRAYDAGVAYQETPIREWPHGAQGLPRPGALEILSGKRSSEGALDAASVAELLECYGLSPARQCVAESVDDAVVAARAIGYPVAIKAADLLHKTEAGGVRLWIRDDSSVREAYAAVAHQSDGAGRPPRALVQEMVEGLVEIYLGISNHHLGYPPLLLVGLGGIYVEVLGDVQRRFAPVSEEDARQMLERLRGRDLILGYRGRRPDLPALARAITSLSALAVELREHVVALDINPLFVGEAGQGVRTADAKVLLRRPPEAEIPSGR